MSFLKSLFTLEGTNAVSRAVNFVRGHRGRQVHHSGNLQPKTIRGKHEPVTLYNYSYHFCYCG